MIAFFPEVYPDELVYSWLARYGVRSGYTHYRAIADDLFTSHIAKPNPEFVMELSQDAYEVITDAIPFESVIMQHTMFPYYARFLPIERRQKAFGQLLDIHKQKKEGNKGMFPSFYKSVIPVTVCMHLYSSRKQHRAKLQCPDSTTVFQCNPAHQMNHRR